VLTAIFAAAIGLMALLTLFLQRVEHAAGDSTTRAAPRRNAEGLFRLLGATPWTTCCQQQDFTRQRVLPSMMDPDGSRADARPH
jgi:hypothetical protein